MSAVKEIQVRTAHGHYHRIIWTENGLRLQIHGHQTHPEEPEAYDSNGIHRIAEYCFDQSCMNGCKQELMQIPNVPGWWKER